MTRKACGRKSAVVAAAAADEEAALARGSHQSASRKQGMESPTLPSTRCTGLLDENAGRETGRREEVKNEGRKRKEDEEKR